MAVLIKKIIAGFLRLNIAKKLFLGYLPLAILIIFIAVFALASLKRLNNINNSIVNTDAPLIEATDKLIDNLIAQELYAHRYVILKSSDMLALFWERGKEFERLIEQIRALPDIKAIPVDNLASLHTEYNNLFMGGVKYLKTPSSPAAKKYDKQIKNRQEELIKLIKAISSEARNRQNKKILLIASIGNTAFWVTAIVCGLGVFFGIGAATVITRNISASIHQLELATKEVSEGRFEYTYSLSNQDEIGDLSYAFSEMTKRLKRLEEMYLDMSPLTRLPGGLAIENILKKRLTANNPLAFCLIDMDNFKAFNDKYGYAMGSEVIKATAHIIEKAVTEYDAYEDFIGHIGGDDFVVITTPERYARICNAIIEAFDAAILNFYTAEDKERGYIIGKNRQNQEIKFPIMAVSIAVVTNQRRILANPAQVGEIAAELKEYAKSLPGSIYVVDKRREEAKQPQGDKLIPFPQKSDSDKKAQDV